MYFRSAFLVVMVIGSSLGMLRAATAHPENVAPFGSKAWDAARWYLNCAPKGCFIFLDESMAGNNTVEVGIDRRKMQPVLFGFITDGDASQSEGITVTFAKTTVNSKDTECKGSPETARPAACYEIKKEDDSTFNVMLSECSHGTCIARVHGRYINDEYTGNKIDLLSHFLNDDQLLFLYKDNKGNIRKRLLDLDGFKDIYQQALKKLQE